MAAEESRSRGTDIGALATVNSLGNWRAARATAKTSMDNAARRT